jgi:hypothetical protein
MNTNDYYITMTNKLAPACFPPVPPVVTCILSLFLSLYTQLIGVDGGKVYNVSSA